jgi:hypothetical protein
LPHGDSPPGPGEEGKFCQGQQKKTAFYRIFDQKGFTFFQSLFMIMVIIEKSGVE